MLPDGSSVADHEDSLISNMLIPGQNREGMPAKEAQTLAERQSNLNEIKAFASMNTEALKRALVLDKFEALMK